jgi:type IV secretory pathway TrbD component
MDLRKLPIRRSLTRSQMIMGGERSLVLLSALSSTMVGFTIAMGRSFILGILVALFCWSVAMFFLKTMGKNDHLMSRIYIRSNKYKNFYPAKGRYQS